MQKEQISLIKYNKFLHQFQPKEQNIFHLAIVVEKYFYMAEIQSKALTKTIKKNFEQNGTDMSLSIYSYTAGVYALLRTAFEASTKLAEYFMNATQSAELTKFRRVNKKEICCEIIDVANDLIKHPIDSNTSDFFCEPGGYDSVGKIDFYKYSATDMKYFEIVSVNPARALSMAHNYFEGLSEIYIDCCRPCDAIHDS